MLKLINKVFLVRFSYFNYKFKAFPSLWLIYLNPLTNFKLHTKQEMLKWIRNNPFIHSSCLYLILMSPSLNEWKCCLKEHSYFYAIMFSRDICQKFTWSVHLICSPYVFTIFFHEIYLIFVLIEKNWENKAFSIFKSSKMRTIDETKFVDSEFKIRENM